MDVRRQDPQSFTSESEREAFKRLLEVHEDWLMQAILEYAERFDYTKYTSTLQEAWRVSIEGLSASLIGMLDHYKAVPHLHPDDDFTQDPAARFGMIEAQRHRDRGVNLAMFLGLMKYYRQCYKRLLKDHAPEFPQYEDFLELIERFFDRTEIAYCSEWAGMGSEQQIQALSATNLRMTNEKNKYLTTFDSFGSPVVLINGDGFVENMNTVATRVFKGADVSGSYYYQEGREPERFDWLEAELSRLIASEERELYFEKGYRSGDNEYVFDVRIKSLPDVSKKFVGYTVLLTDITDLRRTQEQLIVAEKMAALGGMVAGVAHEVNTPVGVGVGAISHLQDRTRRLSEQYRAGNLSEKEFERYIEAAGELTELTHNNLRRAAELVKSFKQVAVDQTVAEVRDFEVREYIEGVLQSLKNQLKRTKIQVSLECPENWMIYNYPGALSQIITNFVLNSLTHGFEPQQEGHIHVVADQQDGDLQLRYSDDGRGIEADIQRRVFDPFFTTNRAGGNTGLGLHIVYKIVTEQLGGKIDLLSNPGKGLEFSIRVPANRPSPEYRPG
jgi:signal transduction histidine kinase